MELIRLSSGVALAERLCDQLPGNIDCIIGIPRSGLMFASIIAAKKGLPLSTPNEFVRDVVWNSSWVEKKKYRNILLVEDSVHGGGTINTNKLLIQQAKPDVEIRTASIFVIREGQVDYHGVVKDPPNLFEWNLLTATSFFGKLLTELDGVICKRSPRQKEPFLIPRSPVSKIAAIVTSRMEVERATTEKWLKDNNVQYESLIMKTDVAISSLDLKIKTINEFKPKWFWESNLKDAIMIAQQCKIPVLCTEDMKIYE